MLRSTVMFARAFGTFCYFCLISYHIHASSWFTCHFTSATSTGVCITGTSALVVCVQLASLNNDKQHDDDVRGAAVVGEMMKKSGLRERQFTFCMEIEAGTLHG